MDIQQKMDRAAAWLLAHTAHRPAVALVLGSGLGDFADTLEEAQSFAYGQIPDFPCSTVPGHKGMLVFGKKQGVTVVAMQGRIHYYEGVSQRLLTLPIRVFHKLGVKTVVLTNACGGVNLNFRPGDLMLISDHINLSGSNPLIGPNVDFCGVRFPDCSDIYTADLRAAICEAAEKAGICLRQGVYGMYCGPNFETPAEIRMYRTLGADVVGMSTVPEALVARHCGMQVVGISCITNMAAGVLPQKLTHEEVMETTARVHDTFHKLLELVLTIVA